MNPANQPNHDPDEDWRPKSASERANERWGMGKGNTNPDAEEPKTARERANERWGMSNQDLAGAEQENLFNPNGDDGSSAGAASASGLAAAETGGTAGNFGFNPVDSNQSFGGRMKGTFWGSKNRKRATIGGGVVGLLLGGGIFGLSILSGPFQFVHFAQLLQQFHFLRTDDFGDDRGNKVMLYALAGQTERGRLWAVTNKAADIWEKNLLNKQGIRPVYTSGTKRFAGYEIVDEEKAKDLVNNLQEDGAQVREMGEKVDGQSLVGGRGKKLDSSDLKRRFIDVSDAKFKDRRALIKTVTKATSTNKVVSAIASRLMKKRGGVDFHLLKDIKRKPGEKLADYVARIKKTRAEQIRVGTEDTTLSHDDSKDAKGNPEETPEASAATDSANELIDEASKSVSKDAIKSIISKGVGPTAVVGVLCAVRGFGNDIPEYKFQNIVMPMYRMGMEAISVGNQVMSGDDVNMDELSVFSQSFYDDQTNTSWSDARSIQAELGEPQTGPPLPSDEQLGNVNNKPWIFNVLSSIPGLGTACGFLNGIGSLPIIKQASGVASSIVSGAINVPLKAFGTSINDLMEKALAAAGGQAVNVLASGAEYGNLANTGAFLAGNDEAIAMGGAPMTTEQTAALQATDQNDATTERKTESLADRYLNPYDHYSLVGSLIDRMPSSVWQTASIFSNPLHFITGAFSDMFNTLSPHSLAADQPYDYGVPTYGFTLSEQEDPEFEDPYANAQVVENNLDALNSKYSVCFGEEAEPTSDGGVSLVTTGNAPNVFKLPAKCDPQKNNDPMFLRYRFYLADLVSAKSMACYEANDSTACSEVGF